ncbi:MHF histone-fold complex component [Yamadazyma tenuis]
MSKEEIESQLKSAVFLMVSRIVEQEVARLGVHSTPMFTASLVELTTNQLLNLGEDLEAFAHHAGRTTIKPEDMYMVVRKNETLAEILRQYEGKLEG